MPFLVKHHKKYTKDLREFVLRKLELMRKFTFLLNDVFGTLNGVLVGLLCLLNGELGVLIDVLGALVCFGKRTCFFGWHWYISFLRLCSHYFVFEYFITHKASRLHSLDQHCSKQPSHIICGEKITVLCF